MVQPTLPRVLRSPTVRGALYYFGYWGVVGAYIPFLYVHFQEIGLTGTQIAVFATMLPLMMLTTAPLIANFADRSKRRRSLLALCIVLVGGSMLLLGYGETFWQLLPLMLLMSFVRSPIAGIGDGLVARMAVKNGVNFGAMRLYGSLGFATVATVCGYLWQRFGYMPMFAVAFVGFLCVAGLGLLLDEDAAVERANASWGPMLSDPGMRTILVTSFLLAGSLSMSGTFEGIMMHTLGGSGLYIGLLLGFTGMSEIPWMRNAPWLANRYGAERTLMVGCLIVAVAHLVYATAWSPIVLLLGAMVRGSGFGLSFVMLVSISAKRAPAGMVASAQAAVTAAGWGLAPLIGIPLTGILYDATGGPRSTFIVCMVMAILAAGVIGVAQVRGMFREGGTVGTLAA
jgi:PPP family 3-phenylpropionic acid transporter